VRIGLKTNWPETIFTIYSGLRGSVGIALALSLNSQVIQVSPEDELTLYEKQTAQLYQMVGGIAFMTLLVNGSTAGPLLKKLGLADEPETRKKIVASYKYLYERSAVDTFVQLLTRDCFKYVDFSVIRFHIPFLKDLTKEQLYKAVLKLKQSTPPSKYRPPHLSRVWPYLPSGGEAIDESKQEAYKKLLEDDNADEEETAKETGHPQQAKSHDLHGIELPSLEEMRLLFINLLDASYSHQIDSGELVSSHPVTLALKSSTTQSETTAKEGKPLDDFSALKEYADYWVKTRAHIKKRDCFLLFLGKSLGLQSTAELRISEDSVYVEQVLSFITAHKDAEHVFQETFGHLSDDLSKDAKTIIEESRQQVQLAEDALSSNLDPATVRLASSHKVCKIILQKVIHLVDRWTESGLLKSSEAGDLLDELQGLMLNVVDCTLSEHEGQKFVFEREDAAAKLDDLKKRIIDGKLTTWKEVRSELNRADDEIVGKKEGKSPAVETVQSA